MSSEIATKKDVDVQSALLKIVQQKDIDPERLDKFMDLQFKMEDRQSKAYFNEALSGFQGECPIIKRIKKIDFPTKSGKRTKYNYAPLDEIVYIIKPFLKKYGLSFSFNIKKTDDKNMNELVTKIYHDRGHSEEFYYYFMPLHDDTRMNMSQRAKSALTYAKRAGLEAGLGLVTAEEDDDANRAVDSLASEAQLEEIKSLVKNTKTDEKKILAFLKVDNFDHLSELEAKKAIHSLRQKRSK